MGQRLIISVNVGGEETLVCYKHWGAYTCSTLCSGLLYADAWKAVHADPELAGLSLPTKALFAALIAWEGSGVVEEDDNALTLAACGFGDFPGKGPKVADDRNAGLIAVSAKQKEDLKDWGEGFLTIDIGPDGEMTFWTDAYGLQDQSEYKGDPLTPPEDPAGVQDAFDALENDSGFGEDRLKKLAHACIRAYKLGEFAIPLPDGRILEMIE